MIKQMWKPQSQLPWRAVKKGSADHYFWYEIVDKDGFEVCIFGSVLYGSEEHVEMMRQIALILTTVNKTRSINIDNELVQIEWLGEGSIHVETC